jgi:hypothetical protein
MRQADEVFFSILMKNEQAARQVAGGLPDC